MIGRVGLKQALLAGLVLVVMGIGYAAIQYFQKTGKQDLQLEILQDQIETRERIDEAIRNAPTGVDESRSVLEQFIQDN